ncbi:DUF2755 family protein [Siccibacter turicensis]|uniref:DUF2755 family protein n=1 Tax=Siccibacter turicensis TaxID=357233 RepID=UPI003F57A827
MADFTISSKPIIAGKKRDKSTTLGNVAYAVFVLFCFWVGSQLLNALMHAPGVFEHLMQMQDNNRPRIEMELAVGTVFGLIPFILGCLLFGGIAVWLKIRRRL